MEIITPDEIEKVRDRFELFTEKDIRKLMKSFQRKQTALLVYAAAVAEREQFNDEEYDILVSGILLIWQCMREKFPEMGKVPVERIDDLDNRLFEMFESMTDKDDHTQIELTHQMIETHKQPSLLETINVMTMEAEPPVRDEIKGLLFFTVKIVLDALIEVS